MQFHQILESLQQKQYQPIYLLHGEEAYFIDQISNYIEKNVLDETEQSFNLTILYGKETDHKTVIDSARRFPMMAPYNVVILKEAQALRQLDKLDLYTTNPSDQSILVICHKHKKVDQRKKFVKDVKKNGVLFHSKPIYENQVPAWIIEYLRNRSYKIDQQTALIVASYLGNDLGKVSNELNKLMINLPQGTMITRDDIDEQIGISKDYNIFELQEALGQKNKKKTYHIIHYFIENPKKHPIVMIIGVLYNYFSKLYMLHFLPKATDREIQQTLGLPFPSFVRSFKSASGKFTRSELEQVFAALYEADLRAKGINSATQHYANQLKELIYQILK